MEHAFDINEHISSYYSASRNDRTTYPSLKENIEVETCVIGGGLAGLGSALPLAQNGHDVTLIESSRIGFGASGRNGGQVIHGWAADMDQIARQTSLTSAQKLWKMSIDAVELVDTQVKSFQIQCAWQRGYACVAIKPRHVTELIHWQKKAASLYHYNDYTWLNQQELRHHLNSQRYIGALLDSKSGHIHPLNYTLGLARQAKKYGAKLFEHTPMQDIQPHQGGYRITTPDGYIHAKNVILAVNAFTNSLKHPISSPVRRYILPVGTYMIATEPLGALAKDLISQNIAVCDLRYVLDYYRLSEDQRLLFGGKVNYSGKEPNHQKITDSMQKDMLKVFPQLSDTRIDYAWGGNVDITMNRLPDFRRLSPNLFILQGFSGHGVAASGIGGLACAEAILGDDSRLNLFESINHHIFPGGEYFKRYIASLGLIYYRLKDLF